jgi:hypothetical protein
MAFAEYVAVFAAAVVKVVVLVTFIVVYEVAVDVTNTVEGTVWVQAEEEVGGVSRSFSRPLRYPVGGIVAEVSERIVAPARGWTSAPPLSRSLRWPLKGVAAKTSDAANAN